MAKSSRGSFTVEFHKVLPEIRQMYESGTVVAKIIYDELYNAEKITMTYNRFASYFRKEITGKADRSTPKKEVDAPPVQGTETASQQVDSKEPLILRVGEKPKSSFSPHTREIDPNDIL